MSPQPETSKTAYVAGTSGVCRRRRRSSTCIVEEEDGRGVKRGGGRSGGRGNDNDWSCNYSGDGEVVAYGENVRNKPRHGGDQHVCSCRSSPDAGAWPRP